MRAKLNLIANAKDGYRGTHDRTSDALIRRGFIRFERVSERSLFLMFHATDAGREALR
jgi:hypothetical protein